MNHAHAVSCHGLLFIVSESLRVDDYATDGVYHTCGAFKLKQLGGHVVGHHVELFFKFLICETEGGSNICIASAPNYGVGLAGKLGIPTLTPSAAPVFLRNINVLASNSSGTAALGLILVGQQAVSIPLLGGRLLVNPIAQAGTLVPVGGLSIPFAVPDLSALCRTPSALSYRVQVLQLDNAAVGGVAMSPGLRLFLGH